MQKQPDGSYSETGFVKTKNGENIDKIVGRNGEIYFTQGFTAEVSGVPPLTLDAIGKPVIDYKIYGNSVQNGTPSPENPIEVKSLGTLVTEGEYSGKYEIPVVCRGKNLLSPFISGGISSTTGAFTANATSVRTDYIPVDFTNSGYILSGLSNKLYSFVSAYDKSKGYLGRTSAGAASVRVL